MLWFVKERENRSDIELLIGVYASEHDAPLGELVGRTATSKLANHGSFRGRRLGKKDILRRFAPLDDGQKRFGR